MNLLRPIGNISVSKLRDNGQLLQTSLKGWAAQVKRDPLKQGAINELGIGENYNKSNICENI